MKHYLVTYIKNGFRFKQWTTGNSIDDVRFRFERDGALIESITEKGE